MHLNTRDIALSLIVLFLAGACQTEEKPLPDELSSTYADLLSYRNSSKNLDSTSFAIGIDSVLASHGFDRESFREAFIQIGQDVDQVNSFFDDATTRLMPPKKLDP